MPDKRIREVPCRSKVQICEQNQIGAEIFKFRGNRFLDFKNQFGLIPDFSRIGQNSRARGLIFLIGNHASKPGVFLYIYLVLVINQRFDPCRGNRHTLFTFFDFFRYAYPHNNLLLFCVVHMQGQRPLAVRRNFFHRHFHL